MGLIDNINTTLGNLGNVQANAIAQQGNIAAQRTQVIGDIHAQTSRANAALWMGFANNVAQQIADAPKQRLAEEAAAQNRTLGALNIEEAKGKLRDRQQHDAELAAFHQVLEENGGDLYKNADKLIAAAPTIGPPIVKAALDSHAAGTTAQIKDIELQREKLRQVATELPSVVDEPSKERFAQHLDAIGASDIAQQYAASPSTRRSSRNTRASA